MSKTGKKNKHGRTGVSKPTTGVSPMPRGVVTGPASGGVAYTERDLLDRYDKGVRQGYANAVSQFKAMLETTRTMRELRKAVADYPGWKDSV